jgi:hypothetical protein
VLTAVIQVDGEEIGGELGGIGTYPELLLEESCADVPSRLHIRTCGCGDPGCWSLVASVHRIDDQILWGDWKQGVEEVEGWPSEPVELHTVRFDAYAYRAEIDRFGADWRRAADGA